MTYAEYKTEAENRSRNDEFAASCVRWAVTVKTDGGRVLFLEFPHHNGVANWTHEPNRQFKTREAAREAASFVGGSVVLLPSHQWDY